MKSPAQHQTSINGINLAWVEWGDRKDPVILFVHATGFHSRCWDRIARRLSGYRIIAYDHRGHGQSSNTSPFSWRQFGRDCIALLQALELQDVFAVGHSMGGHCLLQAAAKAADRIAALCLLDPVVLQPALYDAAGGWDHAVDWVARRRNEWPSVAAFYERLQSREPYSHWHPAVLQDYCRHGLRACGDGFVLACPPAIEAAVYPGTFEMSPYELLPAIAQPVTVVRGAGYAPLQQLKSFSASPTWPELAAQFADGRDIYRPDNSHFIPMEDPDWVASLLLEQLGPGSLTALKN